MSLTNRILQTSSVARRHKDESLEDFCGRITHLQLQGKGLESVESSMFAHCRALTVVYLFGNKLSSMDWFKTQHRITELYLQDNDIEAINGLQQMPILAKLHLDGNKIKIVSGLESNVNLKELSLSHMRVDDGILEFDENSLKSCRESLVLLNIRGNKLTNLSFLHGLESIETLDASDNAIEDLESTIEVLAQLPVTRLTLKNNPITKLPRWWEKMVAACSSVEELDGKQVTPLIRERIKQVMAHQAKVRRGKSRKEEASQEDDMHISGVQM